MSAPGRRAASRRILQELLSTHGTPVGPAAAPSPPRDIATPGHSPAIRSTPAGGEVKSATSNPARLASSITGPAPAFHRRESFSFPGSDRQRGEVLFPRARGTGANNVD